MASAAMKEMRTEGLEEFLERAVERGKGDLGKAVQELMKYLQADEAVWKMIEKEAAELWCWEKVRAWARNTRMAAWLPPNYDKGGKGERVIRLAEGNAESLLSGFRLPIRGLPELGNANKEMVQEAVRFYRSHSVDMLGKARWLDLIAQKLTGSKTVRDLFSDAELKRLQAKALKTVGAE